MIIEEKISRCVANYYSGQERLTFEGALNQIMADELHILRERIGMLEFQLEATESAYQRANADVTRLRTANMELERMLKPLAWQCSGCGHVERFNRWQLSKPCPSCQRRHYWTASMDEKALAAYDEAHP